MPPLSYAPILKGAGSAHQHAVRGKLYANLIVSKRIKRKAGMTLSTTNSCSYKTCRREYLPKSRSPVKLAALAAARMLLRLFTYDPHLDPRGLGWMGAWHRFKAAVPTPGLP